MLALGRRRRMCALGHCRRARCASAWPFLGAADCLGSCLLGKTRHGRSFGYRRGHGLFSLGFPLPFDHLAPGRCCVACRPLNHRRCQRWRNSRRMWRWSISLRRRFDMGHLDCRLRSNNSNGMRFWSLVVFVNSFGFRRQCHCPKQSGTQGSSIIDKCVVSVKKGRARGRQGRGC